MQMNYVDLACMAVRTSQYPDDNLPEFLLVGRSNVGKSSFINTIIDRKNYAHTSSKPGKTQTLNFYMINKKFYLVDVPGYGYAAVSQDRQKKFGVMIEDYIKSRDNLKCVFMLVDYRHKPTEDDVLMYEFLKFYNLKIQVIATKFDKVKKSAREKQNKLIKDTLKLESEDFITFSTVSKKGKDEVLEVIKGLI
ncbi:MAG: ribosome biogenesis GTP-binding protein YihA/YsxC [Bacilli bacterium]|nr:ribosome biogenesis GTP-binding protein YihA/YsxC [Bacilli bacterium]